MKVLADSILGPSSVSTGNSNTSSTSVSDIVERPRALPNPFTPVSTLSRQIAELEGLGARLSVAEPCSAKLPAMPLPNFDGIDLDIFLVDFARWLRLSGLSQASQSTQIDWFVTCCSPKVKKIAEKIAGECTSLKQVLLKLESIFPKLENDLSLRAQIEKLTPLSASPDPANVAQLILDIASVFTKMTENSISDQDKFLAITKKLHPKFFQELRADRFYKHRTNDYKSLKEVILEKSQEDWNERQLFAQQKADRKSVV